MGKMASIGKSEYSSIHSWLRNNYGNASRCENKKCPGISKNYAYALKTDKLYAKNRSHFLELCYSCHHIMDVKFMPAKSYKFSPEVLAATAERNRERCRVVEYQGKKLSVAEWAKAYNQKKPTVHYRLKSGWTLEEALNIPPSSLGRRSVIKREEISPAKE